MCLKSSTQNLLKYINKFVVVCTRTCHHSIGLSMTCQHFDDNRSIGYYIVSSVHKMKLLENHVFFLLAYNIVACQVHKFEDFEIEISFCESWEKLWTMSQVITYDIERERLWGNYPLIDKLYETRWWNITKIITQLVNVTLF